jgi:hypothetical protein
VHTITKIFIILNLLACLVLSQFVWISLAGNVSWRERYEAERAQRHVDKDRLESAYERLLAARNTNRETASQHSIEIAALSATKQVLETWKADAELVADASVRVADDMMQAVQPFASVTANYSSMADGLQRSVENLRGQKSSLYRERGETLMSLVRARNTYAEHAEAYRRLEYQQFLLQEELEGRLDTKARYRWLRPDIQQELGDNGPVIFATVDWAVGNAVRLNQGRRHGVELYQKYSIMRNGRTIAVVNVVDIQNETAEAVIVDLPDREVRPQAGDEAVTRLFMSRLNRR